MDFTGADLRHVTAAVSFEDVDFGAARLTGARFSWSDLIDCTFRGVVHALVIGARPITQAPAEWRLTRVDMTQAKPRRLELLGVNLGAPGVEIELPSNGDYWLLEDWRGFLEAVAQSVARLPDGPQRGTVQIWLDFAQADSGSRQTTGFVAVRDVTDLGGDELLALLAAARERTAGPPESRS
ncbi:MAG TPA: pentapeptide repeat-containing protein [Propionicimonas sp.]